MSHNCPCDSDPKRASGNGQFLISTRTLVQLAFGALALTLCVGLVALDDGRPAVTRSVTNDVAPNVTAKALKAALASSQDGVVGVFGAGNIVENLREELGRASRETSFPSSTSNLSLFPDTPDLRFRGSVLDNMTQPSSVIRSRTMFDSQP